MGRKLIVDKTFAHLNRVAEWLVGKMALLKVAPARWLLLKMATARWLLKDGQDCGGN